MALPAGELRKHYLEYLAHERRLSRHTLESYGRDITILIELAGAKPLRQLDVHDIRRCVAQLHGKGLGARSLARMLSAWRGFYHYLARDHGYGNNPCLGIRPP
ncbi:MAG TPA: site-specific integrase, partial [Burkholderiales bacterium]|nr:site-specific integrase [Burkholderiales bacterium]